MYFSLEETAEAGEQKQEPEGEPADKNANAIEEEKGEATEEGQEKGDTEETEQAKEEAGEEGETKKEEPKQEGIVFSELQHMAYYLTQMKTQCFK